MFKKRGQIAVFLIIAIVLLAGISLFLFSKESVLVKPDVEGSINLKGNQDSLNFLIRSCLEDTTNQAVHDYGILSGVSNDFIEEQIKTNLPGCTDNLKMFEEIGFVITKEDIVVDVEITGKTLTVELEYPITMVKADTIIKFKNQNFILHRIKWTEIEENKETILSSPHREFQMIIPPGARILNNNKQEVGFKILDREDYGFKNNVVMNMLAFDAYPNGAKFSKPVELTMLYNDSEVPFTVKEEDLRIAYYDEPTGVWLAIPTQVDVVENKLVAETYHFTKYAIVIKCTELEDIAENSIVLAIKEDCEPDEGWAYGSVPGGGGEKLFIEGVEVTQGNGIGDRIDTCKGPIQIKYDVVDCSDCKGECSGEVGGQCPEPKGGGIPACKCDSFYYYYYEPNEFKIDRAIEITFEGLGGSCIWDENTEDSVQIEKIDSETNTNTDPDDITADILLISRCWSGEDDTCLILDEKLEANVLTFKLEATNDGEDALLKQGSTVQYSGFGIQKEGSYYVCENDGESKQMPFFGGTPRQVKMADCKCYQNVCKWEYREGTGITDGTTKNMKDRIAVTTFVHPTYSTPCEEYEEDYKGLTFTASNSFETRSRDEFADMYGDYPEMDQLSFVSYDESTELLIFGSAMVDDVCWLLLEAQHLINHNGRQWNLDIWVKKEDVDIALGGGGD